MIATVFVLENRLTLDGLADHIERWVLNSRMLGATAVVVVDHTRYCIGYRHDPTGCSEVSYRSVNTLAKVKTVLPKGTSLVWVEEGGYLEEMGVDHQSLPDFEHPAEDVAYVFGGDISGLLAEAGDGRSWLSVPCGAAWPEAIMSIVLYDRLSKEKAEEWQS